MADTSWIGDEPLEMVSAFASNGTKEVPFDFIGRNEDLEVVILSTSDRMCSHFPDYSFPMYEGVFKYISFRLSFSDFQWEVFRWTKLFPPQIHPNSYVFMRAFELVCQHLKVAPSKNVFSTLFTVQRGSEKGEVLAGFLFAKKKNCLASLRGRCEVLRSTYFS